MQKCLKAIHSMQTNSVLNSYCCFSSLGWILFDMAKLSWKFSHDNTHDILMLIILLLPATSVLDVNILLYRYITTPKIFLHPFSICPNFATICPIFLYCTQKSPLPIELLCSCRIFYLF